MSFFYFLQKNSFKYIIIWSLLLSQNNCTDIIYFQFSYVLLCRTPSVFLETSLEYESFCVINGNSKIYGLFWYQPFTRFLGQKSAFLVWGKQPEWEWRETKKCFLSHLVALLSHIREVDQRRDCESRLRSLEINCVNIY